jgi:hypothetical protein
MNAPDMGYQLHDRWERARLRVHSVTMGAVVDDIEVLANVVETIDRRQRSHEPHLSVHQASLRAGSLIAMMTPAQAALVVAAAEAIGGGR